MRLGYTLILAIGLAGGLATAQGTDPTDYGMVNIRDAGADETGAHWLAVDFALKPGWKTYWEVPGQNGLAPFFDFGRLEGVEEVIYHWPEPHLIGEGGIEAVGYGESFTLPIEIIPTDPLAAITVDLRATFGVCSTVCIPIDLQLQAALDPAFNIAAIPLRDQATRAFDWTAPCPDGIEGHYLTLGADEPTLSPSPLADIPADFVVNVDGICALPLPGVDAEMQLVPDHGNIEIIEGGVDAILNGEVDYDYQG